MKKRSWQSLGVELILWLLGIKWTCRKRTKFSLKRYLRGFARKNRRPFPNPKKWLGKEVKETSFYGMQTFIWNKEDTPTSQKVILYLHGGAYLLAPKPAHFKLVDEIAQKVGARVVFPIYPKLSNANYLEAYESLEFLYTELLKETPAQSITIMGDSAGAGLAMGLALRLKEVGLPQPKHLICFSPWLDLSLSNPEISRYEKCDPMLSRGGLRQLGLLWGGSELALKNPYVSPIYGDFSDVAPLSIFVGTHEIFYPDIEQFHAYLVRNKVPHDYEVVQKMNHVYVAYPIPEAKRTVEVVVNLLRKDELK